LLKPDLWSCFALLHFLRAARGSRLKGQKQQKQQQQRRPAGPEFCGGGGGVRVVLLLLLLRRVRRRVKTGWPSATSALGGESVSAKSWWGFQRCFNAMI